MASLDFVPVCGIVVCVDLILVFGRLLAANRSHSIYPRMEQRLAGGQPHCGIRLKQGPNKASGLCIQRHKPHIECCLFAL